MEEYQTLIGVVVEKLSQTYQDLKMNTNGLSAVLESHSDEEKQNTPELLTIAELRGVYAELVSIMEKRLPGLKS